MALDRTGRINVHEIRRTDAGEPLTMTWLDETHWRAEVELKPGAQTLTLEAVDFHGKAIRRFRCRRLSWCDSLPASCRARLTTGYTLVDRRELSDATTEDLDWLNRLDVDALFDIWQEADSCFVTATNSGRHVGWAKLA